MLFYLQLKTSYVEALKLYVKPLISSLYFFYLFFQSPSSLSAAIHHMTISEELYLNVISKSLKITRKKILAWDFKRRICYKITKYYITLCNIAIIISPICKIQYVTDCILRCIGDLLLVLKSNFYVFFACHEFCV